MKLTSKDLNCATKKELTILLDALMKQRLFVDDKIARLKALITGSASNSNKNFKRYRKNSSNCRPRFKPLN